MNFRPTLWKVLVSILIGGISNFFIFSNLNGGCRGIYCYYPEFVSYRFLFIFVIIVVYILWSLFEVKKEVNIKARGKKK
jgi:hypothetical protein